MVPVTELSRLGAMVPTGGLASLFTCPKVAIRLASALKWPEVAVSIAPFEV